MSSERQLKSLMVQYNIPHFSNSILENFLEWTIENKEFVRAQIAEVFSTISMSRERAMGLLMVSLCDLSLFNHMGEFAQVNNISQQQVRDLLKPEDMESFHEHLHLDMGYLHAVYFTLPTRGGPVLLELSIK